jgi:RNA-directed DNA polymerase
MKRHNNLYERIYSMDNLRLADAIAQLGKQKSPGVIRHNKNAELNLMKLHYNLVNKTLPPPTYTLIKVHDPKEREVFSSPYYPNLILDYAILNVIGPILVNTFTADTYACIVGRGVHKAGEALKRALRSEIETKYYLQIDIKKFYPTVDHDVLKMQLRRKFKDNDLLWLLDLIIDSAPGLPIGRYLSQILSNFYLTGLDHWVKEKLSTKYYFRYVDDLLFLGADKKQLHKLRVQISEYLKINLQLEMK